MPKIFIIILNWNGCQDTIECLESLQKIDYPDFRVVVVDNGSTDNSIDIIPRKYQDISFIVAKKNYGFAGGNNIGIQHALGHGADLVLLLNNDTEVKPDFLKKLVEVAKSDSEAGIVGPLIFFYNEPDTIWFGGGKISWLKTKGAHIGYGKALNRRTQLENKPKTVDYITGCCVLIKKEVIEKIGLLSEDYFLYYEDVDWCLRARAAGYKCIFVPQARIFHKQSKSAHEFSYPYIYYHSRNGLILGQKFGSKIFTYLISFWIFSKQIIKLLIGYKKEWAKPVMKGIMDFWLGKKGKLEGYY